MSLGASSHVIGTFTKWRKTYIISLSMCLEVQAISQVSINSHRTDYLEGRGVEGEGGGL